MRNVAVNVLSGEREKDKWKWATGNVVVNVLSGERERENGLKNRFEGKKVKEVKNVILNVLSRKKKKRVNTR